MTLPTSQECLVPSNPLGEQKGQEGHIPVVANRPPAYASPANVTRGHGEVVPREMLAIPQAPATDHRRGYFDAFML